jgi:hypothetical protein
MQWYRTPNDIELSETWTGGRFPTRVPGLVDAELAAARQRDLRSLAPMIMKISSAQRAPVEPDPSRAT